MVSGVQVIGVTEIISHFSLPIVAVPDVTLTIPDANCTLLQVADIVEVEVIVPAPTIANAADAVIVLVAVVVPLDRFIFSATEVIQATALTVAEPNCTLTPATLAIEDVADTIVCRSSLPYWFAPYKPVP